MERKIGEIFEYNGEWYQTVEAPIDEHSCNGCQGCKGTGGPRIFGGECDGNARKDGKFVIFKKLEKVGKPYEFYGHTVQKYRFFHSPAIQVNGICISKTINTDNTIKIEIKQNKENMEESVEEKLFCDKVAKANAEYMKAKLNSSLKPFDLEAAKAGKPVCTRDGRKARILCFDRFCCDEISTIVACVLSKDGKDENVIIYSSDGFMSDKQHPCADDLMMFPEKKEGWVNVYKRVNEYICENECNVFTGITIFKSEDEAKRNMNKSEMYVNTIKISWEE